MLRNPAIVNLFDGCALSVPCHVPGTAPVGMMIAGTQNTTARSWRSVWRWKKSSGSCAVEFDGRIKQRQQLTPLRRRMSVRV